MRHSQMCIKYSISQAKKRYAVALPFRFCKNATQESCGFVTYERPFTVKVGLRNNRGIGVGPLMFQSWWRGALTLFAQMTDEIEFLVDWVVKRGSVSDVYETLEAMLQVRPQKERTALREIIEGHLRLDQSDVGKYPYRSERFDEETMALLAALEVDDLPDVE